MQVRSRTGTGERLSMAARRLGSSRAPTTAKYGPGAGAGRSGTAATAAARSKGRPVCSSKARVSLRSWAA